MNADRHQPSSEGQEPETNAHPPNEPSDSGNSLVEERRSRVRVNVTYMAAVFLFVGGALFIGLAVFMYRESDTTTVVQFEFARDIFFHIVPIASGILGYWFANRTATKDTQR